METCNDKDAKKDNTTNKSTTSVFGQVASFFVGGAVGGALYNAYHRMGGNAAKPEDVAEAEVKAPAPKK